MDLLYRINNNNHSEEWYRGNVKRADAEKELLYKGQNCNGLFLIRESESKPGDYSLSIRDEDTVKHYRIKRWDDGRFFIAKRVCSRIQEATESSKQPIRARYLGHVTGYQPIRVQGPVFRDSAGS